MTFRISVFEFLFILCGSCGSYAAAASSSPSIDKSWIQTYASPEVEFPNANSEWSAATPGRHPFWVHLALNRILKWDPQDQPPAPHGDCATVKFVERLMQNPDPAAKTHIFEEYDKNCEDQYVTGPLLHSWQALRMFSQAYDIDDHPFLHRVVFKLPDGRKLKGLIALKDNKKRPFVVLRMGIAGNIEEAFPERFFYYQFFERGLFHFLMVENMTGSDFIHNNKVLDFGGLAEAYQNLWLADLLQNPKQPISKLVESLHLVGLSLGGQGVLTSAWLLPHQKNPDSYRSILALCPLVNLGPTFDSLFLKSGWRKLPLEFWAHSRFGEFRDTHPELFESFFGLPHRVLTAIAKDYKKPNAALFGQREPEFLKNQTDFFALHELSKWQKQPHKPMWIWTTNDDWIVPVKINAATLVDQPIVHIKVGNHCSFPAAWDGRITQAMFRGHILGATKFRPITKFIELNVNYADDWDLHEVEALENTSQLKVTLLSQNNKKTSFEMSREDLDFQFRTQVLSEPEKRMIRRWLSTNLVFAPNPSGTGMTVSWPYVK